MNRFHQQLLMTAISGVEDMPPLSPYLDGDLDGMVLELRADDTDSYPGSGGTWFNLLDSPAELAAKADGDFYRGTTSGTSSTDPTFNTDKFTTDGGDCFTAVKQTVASGRASFWDTLLNSTSGGKFSIFMEIDTASSLTSNDWLFSVGLVASPSYLQFGTADNGIVRFNYGTDEDTDTLVGLTDAAALTASTTHIIGISVDVSETTDNFKVWVDSSTPYLSSVSITPTTQDVSNGICIFARQFSSITGLNGQMVSGTSIRKFAVRNKVTSDAEMADVLANWS